MVAMTIQPRRASVMLVTRPNPDDVPVMSTVRMDGPSAAPMHCMTPSPIAGHLNLAPWSRLMTRHVLVPSQNGNFTLSARLARST